MIQAVLNVLAAARVTRLLTEDHIGVWYFRDPIEAWGNRREAAVLDQATLAMEENPAAADRVEQMIAEYDESRPWSWQKRLSEGAGCRWCIGFWVGVLILVSDGLTRTTAFGWARPVFRFVTGALALNLAANTVGKWTGSLE